MKLRHDPLTLALSVVLAPAMLASSGPNAMAASADYSVFQEQRQPATTPKPADIPGPPVLQPASAGPGEAGHNGERGPVFVLNKIRLVGNTVFTENELSAAYARRIDTNVSYADLLAITDEITARYRKAGYFLSRAYVPAQDVVNGEVEVRVLEGRITQVEFAFKEPILTPLEPFAEAIKSEQPIRLATMERQLLLIAQIGGIRIDHTTLDERGEFSGEFSLRVEMTFDRMGMQVSADTAGTRNVGRLQGTASLTLNALANERGTLNLGVGGVPHDPHEWLYGLVNYQTMVAPGLWLGASADHGVLHPDGEDRLISANEDYWNAGVNAGYVALLSRQHLLRFDARFSASNVDGNNMSGPSKRDRSRVIALSATAFHTLPHKGTLTAYAEVERGLNIFGASQSGEPLLSRADAEPDATRLVGRLSWNQPLFGPVSLAMTAAAQATSAPVLSSREFNLGGTQFGRGYEPGVLTGDSGAAASVELRYSKDITLGWFRGFQAYGYYDGGAVWEKGPSGDRTSLASAGGGLRLFFSEDFKLSAEFGVPLTYSGNADGSHPVRANLFMSKSF